MGYVGGDVEDDPSDRRSSLLALTDEGLKLVDAAEDTFTQRLAELIGDTLGGSPTSTVAQTLSELRSVLERDQIGMPTG